MRKEAEVLEWSLDLHGLMPHMTLRVPGARAIPAGASLTLSWVEPDEHDCPEKVGDVLIERLGPGHWAEVRNKRTNEHLLYVHHCPYCGEKLT